MKGKREPVVKMNRRKPIHGWGINDADYVTQPKYIGKNCPYFEVWKGMITRCHCPKFKEKNPSYYNKTVCLEWKCFSNFKCWMETQDWEGKSLDKDILIYGNLEYSPNACLFVPLYVNSFFSSVSTKKSGLPLGVHLAAKYKESKRKYISQSTDNVRYQGCYDTAIEAHIKWQECKLETSVLYRERYSKESDADNRVVNKFDLVIAQLDREIKNGWETTCILY